MNLAAELSYSFPRPNLFQRTVQTIGSTRPGSWFFSKTLARMDRAVARLTKGRTSVPALFVGLPVLVLTTTGRKSGQRRDSHLIAFPYKDDLALLGTNFGQASTPAWVLNLEADPRATVTYQAVTREVVARRATDAERDAVVANSTSFYGGYAKYQQRITGRTLRVFILEAAPET